MFTPMNIDIHRGSRKCEGMGLKHTHQNQQQHQRRRRRRHHQRQQKRQIDKTIQRNLFDYGKFMLKI